MTVARWRKPVNGVRIHAIRGKTYGAGRCRIRPLRRLLFDKSVGRFRDRANERLHEHGCADNYR